MSTVATVQVDDFDPLIVYSNSGQWTTPNPQDNPSFFNLTSSETGSPWYQATYHLTTQPTDFHIDFTGTSLKLIGAKGPSYGNFSVSFDAQLANAYLEIFSAYATENATEPQVLYETDQLALGRHTLRVANLGPGLLIDRVEFTVPIGGEGATLSNTTMDENDSRITYSAGWETNSVDLFYGGTSTYTSEPGAELFFSFEGSALYIYGDQVNDHGEYSVYYNDSQTPVQTLTGRSGCNGDVAKFCEKLGGLHFFDAPLPQGTHRVRLVNEGTANAKTFVDIDNIIFTTPTIYAAQPQSELTCPFTNCDAAASPSGSASVSVSATAPSTSASAAAALPSGGALKTEAFGGALLLALWAVKILGF